MDSLLYWIMIGSNLAFLIAGFWLWSRTPDKKSAESRVELSVGVFGLVGLLATITYDIRSDAQIGKIQAELKETKNEVKTANESRGKFENVASGAGIRADAAEKSLKAEQLLREKSDAVMAAQKKLLDQAHERLADLVEKTAERHLSDEQKNLMRPFFKNTPKLVAAVHVQFNSGAEPAEFGSELAAFLIAEGFQSGVTTNGTIAIPPGVTMLAKDWTKPPEHAFALINALVGAGIATVPLNHEIPENELWVLVGKKPPAIKPDTEPRAP